MPKTIIPCHGTPVVFVLHPTFDLLAGVFGKQDQLGFYVGLRVNLVADLLQLIATYGRGFDSVHHYPGPATQLTFTPPPNLW